MLQTATRFHGWNRRPPPSRLDGKLARMNRLKLVSAGTGLATSLTDESGTPVRCVEALSIVIDEGLWTVNAKMNPVEFDLFATVRKRSAICRKRLSPPDAGRVNMGELLHFTASAHAGSTKIIRGESEEVRVASVMLELEPGPGGRWVADIKVFANCPDEYCAVVHEWRG